MLAALAGRRHEGLERLSAECAVVGGAFETEEAAVAMEANIAEGCGRRGDREFAHLLGVAMRSARELKYEILIARDLELWGTAAEADLEWRAVEVKRMLTAFLGKLSGDGGTRAHEGAG